MACSAILAIGNVRHQHIAGTDTHLETNFSVTNRASETNPMKPVREYHWAHTCFYRQLVERYITVFGSGWVRGNNRECK